VLNALLVNTVDERPGFLAGKLDRRKVVQIPANLLPPWEGAARKLEDADLMHEEQPRAHGIAKPLVSAQDDPSTRPGISGPDIIVELLFGRTVHRPQRVHDESFGAECIGKLVSPQARSRRNSGGGTQRFLHVLLGNLEVRCHVFYRLASADSGENIVQWRSAV
jgi:hypothetical protein